MNLIEQYRNAPYIESFNAKPASDEHPVGYSRAKIRWGKIPQYPEHVNRSTFTGLIVVECKVVGDNRWMKIKSSENELLKQHVSQLIRNLIMYPIVIDSPQGSKDVDTVFTIGIRY